MTVYRAADQDGYDGGWIVDDGERIAWGLTQLEAWKNLMKRKK